MSDSDWFYDPYERVNQDSYTVDGENNMLAANITDQSAAQAIYRNIAACDCGYERRMEAINKLADRSEAERWKKEALNCLSAKTNTETVTLPYTAASSPSERQSIVVQYLTGPKTPIIVH
jgi:hypothetical protein